MNLVKAIKSDRIGPDIIWTHWMLFFKTTSNFLTRKKLKAFGENSSLRPYASIVGSRNISIGKNVVIRSFSQIHCGQNAIIKIEDDVLIAPNVFITTNNHIFRDIRTPIRLQGGTSKDILIKCGSWISTGAVILPGVTVGKNSVVAAGAIVNKDVPDHTVVAGVPAKIIKKI